MDMSQHENWLLVKIQLDPNKSIPICYLEGDSFTTIGEFTLYCDDWLDLEC